LKHVPATCKPETISNMDYDSYSNKELTPKHSTLSSSNNETDLNKNPSQSCILIKRRKRTKQNPNI
jgi:hypothetical protein